MVLGLSWWYSGFPGGSVVKNTSANAGDAGSIPWLGRSPGGEMATHSSILAWTIPWTEEPGGLQSMGWQRVRRDWATELNWAAECAQWIRVCLPVHRRWVWSLVRENFTCWEAAQPMCHNCRVCVLQLLKPTCLEPVLHSRRGRRNEKRMHRNKSSPALRN